MPWTLIIFAILLLITVIIIVLSNRKKGGSHISSSCTTNEDCPDKELCIPNPEANGEKQCFPSDRFFCKIQPTTELFKCMCPKVDENGVCLESSDCDKCLNNPAFSCIQVSDKNPYTWRQGDTTVNIPNSPKGYGWCLPNIVNRNVTCNPYTSEYILSEIGEGEYEWGCWCKYPNLFDHAQGPLSDCTLPRACGETSDGIRPFGKLYVPTKEEQKCKTNSECGDGQVCLDPLSPKPCGYDSKSKHVITNDCEHSNSCVCHVPWEGSYTKDTDPLSGQCVCDEGLDYQCVVRSNDYFEMNCVKDFCTNVPGGKEANPDTCNLNQCFDPTHSGECTCCDCPSGYIRCPDDITANNTGLIIYCEKAGPTCIKDPCATAEIPGGYWSPKDNRCICPGGDSFVSVPDENSAVGAVCKDACQGNGPCGNRGTCFFPEGGLSITDARCCDCHCPFTNEDDNTCTCSATMRGSYQTVKGADGSACCSDDDCCSGNCESPDCDKICVYHGVSKRCPEFGTCRGPIETNSKCDGKTACLVKPPEDPVTCPDNTMCPYKTTCCSDGSDGYNCCPYDGGTCCGDGLHCCPSSLPVCNVEEKMCYSKDGTKKAPWTDHT